MEKEELFSLIGFIKISNVRYNILNLLSEKYMMPSELANKMDLETTQISNALKGLKTKKLVACINEKDKKGRIYEITDLGKEVLNELKNNF